MADLAKFRRSELNPGTKRHPLAAETKAHLDLGIRSDVNARVGDTLIDLVADNQIQPEPRQLEGISGRQVPFVDDAEAM